MNYKPFVTLNIRYIYERERIFYVDMKQAFII